MRNHLCLNKNGDVDFCILTGDALLISNGVSINPLLAKIIFKKKPLNENFTLLLYNLMHKCATIVTDSLQNVLCTIHV